MVRNFTIATSAVCGQIPASSVLQYRHFRVPALDSATASRVTAYGMVIFELASLVHICRLPWHVIAVFRAWIPTRSPRTLRRGTGFVLQHKTTAVQPSSRRGSWASTVARFRHPEHRRQDVGPQVLQVYFAAMWNSLDVPAPCGREIRAQGRVCSPSAEKHMSIVLAI